MHRGCICVSRSIQVDSYLGRGRRSEELALAAEAAAASALVFEFDQAAGGLEDLEVLLAIEGGEHAGVVAVITLLVLTAVLFGTDQTGAPGG